VDGELLERARAIADGLLWPNVAATDAAEVVPAGHLDVLAAAGLTGSGRRLRSAASRRTSGPSARRSSCSPAPT
jgi:hypothetical protein